MSSSCLSAATIVRCPSLSNLQNGIVFIPAAVQIIFLVSLAALYWRSGRRKHFIVLADGSAFYIVALLDLLSHLVPVARNRLDTFKIFDIVIGALSFVPILLYTTFLFLFSRSYFIPTLSRIPRVITKYALLALIPITIAMSELGSFLGIGYTILQDREGESFLAIGFRAGRDQTLWQFFTSITLVLLIIFQAFIFLFSVYVAALLIQERRIGRSFFEGCDMPTLRGVIWIAIGVKIGAVESLLGFISGGFSIILARRILRMVSRCCLAFGALQSEGARVSRNNGHRRSRTMSQIRAMISNPRASTFMRLSPTAEEFYSMPRAADGQRRDADEPVPRRQRVTVHYDARGAPELNLRLSALDVPDAEVLTATFNKRGTIIGDPSWQRGRSNTGSTKPPSRSLTRSLSAIAPPSEPMGDYPALPGELRQVLGSRNYATDAMGTLRPNPKFSSVEEQRQSNGANYDGLFLGRHTRYMSSGSLASDSMSIVNNLASQFPGIPPRRTASGRRFSYSDYRNTQARSTALDNVEEATERGTIKSQVSPSNSIKRKPPPTLPAEGLSRPDRPRRLQKSQSSESKLSQSSSLRRRAVVPPPIDSVIAGPDASLAQRVSITPGTTTATATTTPYTGHSERTRDDKHNSMKSAESSARVQTPGMTYRSGNSTTDHDTDLRTVRDLDGAIDPFADSDAEDDVRGPEYQLSDLATAESGLNRIASKVVQYDRQRRQAYRGAPQPSPVKYGPFDGSVSSRQRRDKPKSARADADWDMIEFPGVNDSLGVPISRPRPLSAISSNSSNGSLQNATAGAAKRVTVAARHGPTVSNASIVPSAAFKHMHTTSTSSAQTRASHTERELMRIKSVGRVATRRTPTPTPSTGSFAARQSMRIDSMDFGGNEMAERESPVDSPASARFRNRPLYESGASSSVFGGHSALREGWTADSDDDEVVVAPERRRSRNDVGLP